MKETVTTVWMNKDTVAERHFYINANRIASVYANRCLLRTPWFILGTCKHLPT